MSENTANIIVNLTGNLARNAQKYSQSIGRLSAKGRQQLGRLSGTVNRLDASFSRLGNRWVALGSGGAIAVAAKGVIDFDAELTQLGVDADINNEKLKALKDQIHDVANASNIRVDRDELLAGIKEITARTGEISVATDNLTNIGLLMRATGARAVDSAALIANYFEKFDIRNPEKMLQVLSESAVLGKQGAFELRDLATEGNSVAAAYASTGRQGPKAIREMNTMLQIIRRTAPSASEAATNFDRLISTITTKKVGVIQGAGIAVWDKEQLSQGNKIARAIPDIIVDILKASNADQEVLGKLFDENALKAMQAFAAEFRRTGAVESIDAFMAVTDDGSQILKDAGRNAKTAKAAISSLTNAVEKFSDKELSKPIENLARWIDKLDSEKLDNMLSTTKQWAIALGAVVLATKGIALGVKVAGAVSSTKRGQGVTGGLLGATPATPMYVRIVGGGVGLGADGGKGKKTKAGKLSKLKGLGRAAGVAALPATAAFAVGDLIGTQISNAIAGTKVQDAIGEGIAHAMAGLGSQSALQALKANGDLSTSSNVRSVRKRNRSHVPEPARVEIEVKGDTKHVSVRARRNRKRGGTDVTVTGTTMGTL